MRFAPEPPTRGGTQSRRPSELVFRLSLVYRRRPAGRVARSLAVLSVLTTPGVALRAQPVRAAEPAAADGPLQPVTRAQAVSIALERGVAAPVGRADTAAANAGFAVARALPNPTLAASYTGSAPQLHASVDIPLDLPAFRGLRVNSARAALASSRLQFAYTRATVRYDVEVAYGQALAAGERATLSRQSARDADSLLTLARRQRDAGDASDVDVDLASINAGQQENVAAGDSLAAITTVLDLQTLLGLQSDQPRITLAESLPALIASALAAERVLGGQGASGAVGITTGQGSIARQAPPLQVAAAAATYEAQDFALGLARRRNALVPSVQVGVEGRDPTGGPRGPLPLVGFSLPLPLFNRFQGDVALANANRVRAAAQFDAARRTAAGAIARARRDLVSGATRVERDRVLLETARRVAAKTLTGYRTGASALPAVLQAQRSVRDAFVQYATDAVTAANAAAAVRLATASEGTP